jgi:hypothetical protein
MLAVRCSGGSRRQIYLNDMKHSSILGDPVEWQHSLHEETQLKLILPPGHWDATEAGFAFGGGRMDKHGDCYKASCVGTR